MERKIYSDLVKWKNSDIRKPLILQGARQVGKTYIVNYFAGKEYATSIYCNFEKDHDLYDFFRNLSPSEIIKTSAPSFQKKTKNSSINMSGKAVEHQNLKMPSNQSRCTQFFV